MFEKFLANRSGSVAVQFGLAATMLLMFSGSAIDYAMMAKARNELQHVADAAALRLAGLPPEDRGDAAAGLVAHGLERAKASMRVTAHADRITIEAHRIVRPAFLRFVGYDALEVSVRAIAESVSDEGKTPDPGSEGAAALTLCVLALNEHDAGSIKFAGNASFSAPACAVQANSRHAAAIERSGAARAEAAAFCARGGTVGIAQNVHSGCFMNDPFASIPAPASGSCAQVTRVGPSQSMQLRPGTYCDTLEIQGTAFLEPGVYVLQQGLQINAQAHVRGDGVVFYFANDPSGKGDATFTFNGGADIRLSAPGSGEYEGMLLVQDKSASPGAVNRINGGNATYLRGAIYTPTQRIRVNGNGTFGSLTDHMPIVADTIEFTGTSRASASGSAYRRYRLPSFAENDFSKNEKDHPASALPKEVRLIE